MPTIDSGRLESTATRIFEGLGAPPGDAAWIARLLVLANLRGHDSHGVIRIPQYIASWREGEIDAKAEPVVLQDELADFRVHGAAKGSVRTGEQLAAALATAREHGATLGWRGALALAIHRLLSLRTRLLYLLLKP